MKIAPIPHEPTCFTVQSSFQLVCPVCRHEFRWPRRNGASVPLEKCRCPKCEQPDPERPVEPVCYRQDVAAYWGHGQCGCADYRVRVGPKFEVKDFSPQPCKHLLMAFLLFGQAQAKKLGEAPQVV